MWVWVTFAYLIPAVAITMQLLSPSNPQSRGPVREQHEKAGRSRNGGEAEVI